MANGHINPPLTLLRNPQLSILATLQGNPRPHTQRRLSRGEPPKRRHHQPNPPSKFPFLISLENTLKRSFQMPSSFPLTVSRSATGTRYPCLFGACEADFSRLTDLKRHMRSVHEPDQNLMDCPYSWCGRTGSYGFTRKDHLNEHIREVHKANIPKARRGKLNPP